MNFYSSWWAAAHVELLQKYRAVLQIALILREMGEWASRGGPLWSPRFGRARFGAVGMGWAQGYAPTETAVAGVGKRPYKYHLQLIWEASWKIIWYE